MKMRSDSPFAGLSEDQQWALLELSETPGYTIDRMVDMMAKGPKPLKCSVPAMRRFVQRMREERALRDAEESAENVEALAKRGNDPHAREAALAVARQKLLEDALATTDRTDLLKTVETLSEEKARDRQFELEERKVRVAEENARIGWKRLEYDRAISAAKLLPKVWAILTDGKMDPLERVTRAQECLAPRGEGSAPRLLGEG